MKICVVGMGKIGLPLAVQFAKFGNEVVGLDINEKVVAQINEGIEPFPEEAHLPEFLRQEVDAKRLRATTSYPEAITVADVVVVVVPLFVNNEGEPDFRSIDLATSQIGESLQVGSLVCYETTLPIGTTSKRFAPMLESASGLKAGEGFNLVFSPERVLTGRIFEDLGRYPKIVGGFSEECTKAGKNFYASNLPLGESIRSNFENGVWEMKSCEEAEFVKLAETTYRDVNIGLANQFFIHAESIGIDFYEIQRAANSQPYSHIHTPGISVGGHCIPVYPKFYLSNNPEAEIVRAARLQNEGMPEYFYSRILKNSEGKTGLNILVLGLSYRANVKEAAYSGAHRLYRLIEESGNNPFIVDPLFTSEEIMEMGYQTVFDKNEVDYAILHTPHTEFHNFDFSEMPNLVGIVDGRNFFDKSRLLVRLL
jgi:UDP-N-acetyl-D-glucosamine dehydrogenase